MKNDILAKEIQFDLDALRQTAELATQLLQHARQEQAPWLAAAAAKYIADVFMGVENLWKRRCRRLGQSVPDGPTSHYEALLAFLADPELGGRLPPDLEGRLGNYLRFRHRFVHGYGVGVAWAAVEEPLSLNPDTVAHLCRVWEQWLAGQEDSPPR